MSVRFGVKLAFLTALLASTSFAAQTVSIEVLDPPSNNIAAGYYIGPYQALVNGVPTDVICDDFAADTPMNAPWDANVMTIADLTDPLTAQPVRWTSATVAMYEQAGWLALQLAAGAPSVPCTVTTGNCGADIQFAIWSLFDSAAGTYYDGQVSGGSSAISYWLAQAAAHYTDVGVNYADVLIYTPTPLDASSPQEFLSVRAPEPSSLVLLALNGLGVLCLTWFVRRRTSVSQN